jgi:ribosomal protein S24E
MEIVLKDKKENDLLKRTEILAIIKSEITPKMQDATKALVEYLHANPEFIVIKRMKGKFGRQEFEVEACIYESREAMQKIEPKPKAKKEQKQEAKPEGKSIEKEGEKKAKPENPEEKKEGKKPERKTEEKTEQKSSK